MPFRKRWPLAAVLGSLLLVNLYFAVTLPATSAEAAVYTRNVSQPLSTLLSQPFVSQTGLPYLLLEKVFKWVAGVSELTLRFPSVLGGALFAIAIWRLNWRWGTLLFLLAANAWNYRAFCTASGQGLALGLLAMAICQSRIQPQRAGLLLGLSIGTSVAVAPLAALFAIGLTFLARRSAWLVVDEVIVPALLIAALCLSPALLSTAKPLPASPDDTETRALVRQIPAGSLVSLGVSAALEPGVNFYRRRLHLSWIQPAILGGPDGNFDFFLLARPDEALVQKRRLTVISRAAGEILAKK